MRRKRQLHGSSICRRNQAFEGEPDPKLLTEVEKELRINHIFEEEESV